MGEVEAAVVITTSFPWAGEPVPRSLPGRGGSVPEQECGRCGGSARHSRGGRATLSGVLGFPRIHVGGCLCVCVSAVPEARRGFLHPQFLPNRSSSSFSRHWLQLSVIPSTFSVLPAGPVASAQSFDVRCQGFSLPITPHVLSDNLSHPWPWLSGLHS